MKIGENLHSVGVWEFKSVGVWTIALPLATQAGRQLSIVNFQFSILLEALSPRGVGEVSSSSPHRGG